MPDLNSYVERAKAKLAEIREHNPPLDVALGVTERYSADDAGSYAAAMTYFMFFSIFPLLLFAAALLGYLTFGDNALRETLLNNGVKAVPFIRDALSEDALDLIIEKRRGLALTAVVLALYSGSGGVIALSHALNRIHGFDDPSNWFKKRLHSLRWLGILGLGALLAVTVAGVREWAADRSGPGPFALEVVAFGAGLAVSALVFATAYRYLPTQRIPWRSVWPGALVAGIGFQVLNVLGSAYLEGSQSTRSATFGVFATAATLLLATYLVSQLTLVAAEVNLVLDDRNGVGSPQRDADKEAP